MIHHQTITDASSLRPGRMYAATTVAGRAIVGEYLGIEVAHGEWAMLVHTASGVESLPLTRIATVTPHS